MQSCPAASAAPGYSGGIIRAIARPAFLSCAELPAFEFRIIVTDGAVRASRCSCAPYQPHLDFDNGLRNASQAGAVPARLPHQDVPELPGVRGVDVFRKQ